MKAFSCVQLIYIRSHFLSPATVENFNIVETLSDNAVIIYQTHKVRGVSD